MTACALGPVLTSIAVTAIGKQVSTSHPYQGLIFAADLLLAALALLFVPIAKWLVLRRFLPALRFYLWSFAVVGATILLVVVPMVAAMYKFFPESELWRVAAAEKFAGTLTTWRILTLPWPPVLLLATTTAAAISLFPAWALGRASRLRWGTLVFLAASVAGTLVSTIVEQTYFMRSEDLHFMSQNYGALNGVSWLQRLELLSLRAGIGAVWGATTAFVVVLLLGRLKCDETPRSLRLRPYGVAGLVLLAAAPLIIAVQAPFAGYLVGRNGIATGAIELRRALSFAPERDLSQGEAILIDVHDIQVPVAKWGLQSGDPTGRTVIVRTVDHALVQVDLATGRAVRQVADEFGPYDSPSTAWSPDGRYLAVLSDGANKPIARDRPLNRIRLYAPPGMNLEGEFTGRDGCLRAHFGSPMLFSHDSKTLWLACSVDELAKPDRRVAAMRFDVPSMTSDGVGIDKYFVIQGLERVGTSIWAWQSISANNPFRIYDLTKRTAVASIKKPLDLIGGMTEQGLTHIDQDTVRLKFCGLPPRSPADAGLASSICRTVTLEIATGSLLGSADEADHRFGSNTGIMEQRLVGKGLRIEALWRNDNKTGELIVRDLATGRERQRITSVAQRPLQMSADGQWLITSCVHEVRLRVYRLRL